MEERNNHTQSIQSVDNNPLIPILGDNATQPSDRNLINAILSKIDDRFERLALIDDAYRQILSSNTDHTSIQYHDGENVPHYETSAGSLADPQLRDMWNLKLAYLETIKDIVNKKKEAFKIDESTKSGVMRKYKDSLRLISRKIVSDAKAQGRPRLLDFDTSSWQKDNGLEFDINTYYSKLLNGDLEFYKIFSEFLKAQETTVVQPYTGEELALVMLQCYISSQDKTTQESELYQLLQHQNTKALSHWLHLHSSVKWRLQQVISQSHYNDDLQELKININAIIHECFEEENIKKNLEKFAIEDVGQDYIETRSRLSQAIYDSKHSTQTTLNMDTLRVLVNAKNRRAHALGRAFNGVCVGHSGREKEAFGQLMDSINAIKVGERKQIFYMGGSPHVISFDIERKEDGKLNILCFESAADKTTFKTLNQLTKSLDQKQQSYELKSCISYLQNDFTSCAIYSLAAMNELAKYPHVFDYLPATLTSNYQPDLAAIRGGYRVGDIYFESNIESVKWVMLDDMPTKVISMAQSYTYMKEILSNVILDDTVDEFINHHKLRHDYPVEEISKHEKKQYEEKKYIGTKRKHIGEQLEKAGEKFLQIHLEKEIEHYPMIALINNSSFIDEFRSSNHKDADVSTQLNALKKVFNIISLMHLRKLDFPNKPDIQISKNYLAMREAYLELLLKLDNGARIAAEIKKSSQDSTGILYQYCVAIDANEDQLKNAGMFDRFNDLVKQVYIKLGEDRQLLEGELDNCCLDGAFNEINRQLTALQAPTLSQHILVLLNGKIFELQHSRMNYLENTKKIESLREIVKMVSAPDNQTLTVELLIENLKQAKITAGIGFLLKIKSDFPTQSLGEQVEIKTTIVNQLMMRIK